MMTCGPGHKLVKATRDAVRRIFPDQETSIKWVSGDSGYSQPIVGVKDAHKATLVLALKAWNEGARDGKGPFPALGAESVLVSLGDKNWITAFVVVLLKPTGGRTYDKYATISGGVWIPEHIAMSAQDGELSIGDVLKERFKEEEICPSECNPHEFLTRGSVDAKALLEGAVEILLSQAYLGPNFDLKKEGAKKE